ncbi:hypothetical protein D5086_025322 [Populus alba]|uniref:Uncharacterized protein n=1 Tax=Populus alba TaxID=43335 RepID=A0ACC4AYV4_POPAL
MITKNVQNDFFLNHFPLLSAFKPVVHDQDESVQFYELDQQPDPQWLDSTKDPEGFHDMQQPCSNQGFLPIRTSASQ